MFCIYKTFRMKKHKTFGHNGKFKQHKRNKFNKQKIQKKKVRKFGQKIAAKVENDNEKSQQHPKESTSGGHERVESIESGQQKNPLIQHEKFAKWYESDITTLTILNNEQEAPMQFEQVQKKAEELLKRETEIFSQWYRARNRGDADWLDTVAKKGTFADRLSSLQVRVQRSPIHALSQLRNFVELFQRKGAKIRQAHSITKALKELFLTELLPPDRKLFPLNQRPLEQCVEKRQKNNRETENEKRLIYWQFESELKQCYRLFLEGLESLAGNMVEGVAENACREICELLMERPEQEQFLLSALVNRLGHPQSRIAAKVAQMLEQLVQRHPNMRPVVVKEVEQLMFRKNISPKAQRYGLHFLSRLLLDAGEFELALQLVQIYLRLFRIMAAKEVLNEYKLLPLLVTGLNRAFPYARGKATDVNLMKDLDSLYTIVQTSKFSTALSVLRLLFQIHSTSEGISDRFYCAFYRRLLNLPSATAGGATEQMTQFFELLKKMLKNDLVECRVRAFVKRLLQVALASNSAFAAAALLVCNDIVCERPQLLRLDPTLNAQILDNAEFMKKSRQKAKKNVKEEKNSKKKTIPVKKEEPIEENISNKSAILEEKLKWFEENQDEDEEEEHYEDVRTQSDEEVQKKDMDKHRSTTVGWMHRLNGKLVPTTKKLNGELKQDIKPMVGAKKAKNSYDPTARNPLFAGADFALNTELYTLARHYHPTVANFAKILIRGEQIQYKGDPLIDLGHMRFLDRFAFKNPKTKHKNATAKESNRPLFASIYTPRGVKALNPTSQEYVTKNSAEIPLDERFLHHFAALKFRKEGQKKKEELQKDDEADEMESLNSDEFDMLMEKFEPGESRDTFEVDFSSEFGQEADTKRKQKALKRKRNEAFDEDEDGEGLAESDFSGEEDVDGAGSDEFDDDGDVDDDEDEAGSDLDIHDFDEDDDVDEEEEEEMEYA